MAARGDFPLRHASARQAPGIETGRTGPSDRRTCSPRSGRTLLAQSSIPAGRQRSRRRRALYLRPAGNNCKSCVRSGLRIQGGDVCVCVSLDWIIVLVHALIAAGLVDCADEFRERLLGLTAVQETQVYVRACCPPPPPHCSFTFAVAVIRLPNCLLYSRALPCFCD